MEPRVTLEVMVMVLALPTVVCERLCGCCDILDLHRTLFRWLPRSKITVDLTIEMLLDSTCDGPAHTVENSDIDFGECCLLYGG